MLRAITLTLACNFGTLVLSIQMKMSIPLGNKGVHPATGVAFSLHIVFQSADIRAKPLNSVVIDAADAGAKLNHLQNFKRREVFTEEEDVFVALEAMIIGEAFQVGGIIEKASLFC